MKRSSLFAMGSSLLFLATLSSVLWGQVATTADHSVLMNRKLTAAQKVLEGIARDDFSEIARQAQYLRLLSQEAGWNVLQTAEYTRLSNDFRGTTEQLAQAAKTKNMDAVGLAYVKLSISCIDCHRHVKVTQNR